MRCAGPDLTPCACVSMRQSLEADGSATWFISFGLVLGATPPDLVTMWLARVFRYRLAFGWATARAVSDSFHPPKA